MIGGQAASWEAGYRLFQGLSSGVQDYDAAALCPAEVSFGSGPAPFGHQDVAMEVYVGIR